MAYLSNDLNLLLGELDLKNPGELFEHIPENLRKHPGVKFPVSSESGLLKEAAQLGQDVFSGINYSGYGLFEHEIPLAVSHAVSSRNFVTSYTPYQPEVAQGTLQALFEYQSMMASLTSMDVVNASMYDGASALAEAIRMDIRQKPQREEKKRIILLSEGIYPYILDVLKTYFPEEIQNDLNIKFEMVPLDAKTGSTKWAEVTSLKDAKMVVVMNPTMWGTLEKELPEVKKINPDITLLYGVCETLSLSVLAPPSEYGTDIVWGDAQSLGMPVAFGGPSLGFLAAKSEYTRQMPGRLIGKTKAKDKNGAETDSYVITLATREQHIRREKATSNICSNQSLMAVCAGAYMAYMGWAGMQGKIQQCRQNAQYFKEALLKKGGNLRYPEADYFHEISWVENSPDSENQIINKGMENGFYPGVFRNGSVIAYFSELRTKEEIDRYVGIL